MITALLLVTCLAAQPASGEKPELSEQVKQLVRQLDDRELARREEAEKELVDLGPDVLPLLPQPTNRMAAEIRQRLARIRSALEKVASVSTMEASTVTLAGETTVTEALNAIAQQTGNAFAGHEGIDVQVKTDFQETPFWAAVDHLLDQGQLNTEPLGGQPNTLVLMARPETQAPRVGSAYYDGPFRVEALRVFALRDLRNPNLSGMRVAMSIAWEPRLSPISVGHPFTSAQAADEHGNAIAVSAERGGREAAIHPGMTGVEVEIPLQLTERTSTKIASFRGEFNVLVPGKAEQFVFDGKLARGMQEKRAGVTVILEAVRKNVDLHQIVIRVRFEEPEGALQSHRAWILANEAYLLDPGGERVENAGYEATTQKENEVGVAYLFALPEDQKDLSGYQFIYETPTTIIRETVPYELKDLPLP